MRQVIALLFILSIGQVIARPTKLPVSISGLGPDILVASGTLGGITPNNGNLGQSLAVSVSGINTSFNSGSASFYLSQGSYTLYLASPTIVSNTQAGGMIYIPGYYPTGLYDMTAYNFTDGYMYLNSCFQVNGSVASGTLVSIAPNSANAGQFISTLLTGSGTNFMSGSSTVYLSMASSTTIFESAYSPISNTQRTCDFNIPANAATGYYDLNFYSMADGFLSLPYSFYIGSPTGIDLEQNDKSKFVFYPNPVQNTASLKLPLSYTSMPGSIEIFDLSGKKIVSQFIEAPVNGTIPVPVSGLTAGKYILVYTNASESKSIQFEKK